MMVRGPKSSQDSRKFQSHLQEKLETYKETIRIIFKYMKVHDGLQYLVWPQGNNTHEWNVQGNSFLSQHKGKWDAWENWGLHDLWSGMLQRRFLGINWVVGINFFVFFFYCYSIPVVPVFPPLLSPALPCPPSSPTFNPPHHCCLCPWVLYTFSLTWPFHFFPLLSSSPLPYGYCQFVLYFHVSASILLACLFCWLGSTYGWDHMVFVFHLLAYFT